jgi:hypothetical protein
LLAAVWGGRVPAALVGAASCGRCGFATPSDAGACPNCGIALLPAAPGAALGTYAGLLTGVAPAGAARRRWSAALDAVLVLVPAAVAATSALLGGRDAAIAAAAVAVLVAAIDVALLLAQGRTFGRLVFGIRTVDDLSGTPVGGSRGVLRALALGYTRGAVAADLRAGRDPLASAASPITVAELGAALLSRSGRRRAGRPAMQPSPPASAPSGPPAESVTLVLDAGTRIELTGSLLIGRNPANPEGQEHAVYAWPDLSRSLSKTHALLEWRGGVVWITDLHSTNGTRLVAPDGGVQPLVPDVPGPAGPGWTVRFGDRRLTVHAGGAHAGGAA